jgi:hypothetical protein
MFYDVAQGEQEWHDLRLGKATASNFGTIMANAGKPFGDPAKRYALQLALEIETGRKSLYSFSNAHMERGIEQESEARNLYESETFTTVLNGGFFCHDTHGSSPDGLVADDGVIEIKAVIAPVHYATLQRNSFDPSYRWQLVGHLLCTGRQWVDFISYCADFPEGNQLLIYRLDRNDLDAEIKQLQVRLSDFLKLVQQTLAKIRD